MNIRHLVVTGIVIGALSGGGTVWAQAPQDVGFYLGGSLGYTALDFETGGLAARGMTTLTSDDSDTGWKLFAGYQFHRNWAVEGSYYDLGNFNASGFVTASPATPANVSVKIKGWGLAAVGILPLQQNFSLFGKLGGFWSDSSASASAATFATTGDSNSDWLGGIGVMYNFSRNFGVRAEAEFIGSDTQFYSIGLQYKF